MYGAPNYDLPDDVTLLPFDDFDVNDVIRSIAVPSMDIATKGGQVIRKDKYGKRHGKARKSKGEPDRRAAPRKTLMEKFQRAVRKTNPGNFFGSLISTSKQAGAKSSDSDREGNDEEEDEEKIVRKPRKSRVTLMAQKAGAVAANSTFEASTAAVGATGRGFRMTAKAMIFAAKKSAPIIARSVTRGSKLGSSIFKAMQDEKANKQLRAMRSTVGKKNISRDYKKKWMAACTIQQRFRLWYHRQGGPKYHRASRLITNAIREYIHMINHEKWMMVIKMELQANREKEERGLRTTLKAEKASRLKKQIRRAGAERAAKAVGWGSSAMKTAKWIAKDEAIMCACFMKFGFPTGDVDWQMFYKYFPEKPRRNVRTKLNSMKDDGMLSDPATMQGIEKKELEQLGLKIHVKKEKKKKTIDLADLL